MDKLRQTLLNAIEIKDENRCDVAKHLNISSSRVTDFLKDKQELPLDVVVKFVRFMDIDNEEELMMDHIKEISRPSNVRYAMEYCSTHGDLDTLGWLLSSNGDNRNKLVKEYVKVYNLVLKFQKREYERVMDFYSEIRSTQVKDETLKALLLILEVYVFYNKKEYTVVKSISEIVEPKVKEIKEDFMRKSLTTRINQSLGFIELKHNCDFMEAEKRAEEILECHSGHSYDGFAYYILGMSNMDSDFNKSLTYFKKSISKFKKCQNFAGVKSIKHNISILHLRWSKVDKDKPSDDIYNLVVKSDCSEDVLMNQSDEYKSSPEFYYLKGLINNDKDFLYKGMTMYLKSGDNLLATLPKRELIKLGEKEEFINQIENINMTA